MDIAFFPPAKNLIDVGEGLRSVGGKRCRVNRTRARKYGERGTRKWEKITIGDSK